MKFKRPCVIHGHRHAGKYEIRFSKFCQFCMKAGDMFSLFSCVHIQPLPVSRTAGQPGGGQDSLHCFLCSDYNLDSLPKISEGHLILDLPVLHIFALDPKSAFGEGGNIFLNVN